MPIITAVPAQSTHPEIPFDKLGVHLNIAPIWSEKSVSGSCSIRVVPYRELPDGTIERREDLARMLSIADIFAESATDPDFGAAMAQVWTGIQQYIVAKSL